jgi:hypothetical protein
MIAAQSLASAAQTGIKSRWGETLSSPDYSVTSVLSACPAKPWRSGVPFRPIFAPLLAIRPLQNGKVMQGKARVFDTPPRVPPGLVPKTTSPPPQNPLFSIISPIIPAFKMVAIYPKKTAIYGVLANDSNYQIFTQSAPRKLFSHKDLCVLRAYASNTKMQKPIFRISSFSTACTSAQSKSK